MLLTADRTQVKRLLAEIDAPESGQPYGMKSSLALADLACGKRRSRAARRVGTG